MKRVIVVGAMAVVVLTSAGAFWLFKQPQAQTLSLGAAKVELEIADEPAELVQGLSNRQSLEKDHGMLFIFADLGRHGIWMKEMQFNIDIIWLDENKKVIAIAESVKPESYPTAFQPNNPAKYVLEVNEGFVKQNMITKGQQAQF